MVDVKDLTLTSLYLTSRVLRATALAKDRIPALIERVESFEEADEPVVIFSALKPMKALARRDGWGIITSDTTLGVAKSCQLVPRWLP